MNCERALFFATDLQILHAAALQGYPAIKKEAARLANTIQTFNFEAPRTTTFPRSSIYHTALRYLPKDASSNLVPIRRLVMGTVSIMQSV